MRILLAFIIIALTFIGVTARLELNQVKKDLLAQEIGYNDALTRSMMETEKWKNLAHDWRDAALESSKNTDNAIMAAKQWRDFMRP